MWKAAPIRSDPFNAGDLTAEVPEKGEAWESAVPEAVSKNIPVFELKAGAFTACDERLTKPPVIRTYIPEGKHYRTYIECPEATLPDVVDGKVTLEEFVASLDTGVLLRLVTGVASETPYLVESRMKVPMKPLEAPRSSGQTTSQYVESLGIPNTYLTDGPAGLYLGGQATTAWPVGMPQAQSWNPQLIEAIGDGFGKEMDAYDQTVILGPGMNIHRDPLCGRNFEYYSEDPLLSGKCAAAFTRGVQSHKGRMVSLKHFACNNQETDRACSNSSVSQRALREIYLKGFEIAVREAKPGTIMTSYNKINGRHSSENKELLQGIVRGEWGFDGLFMTDWNSQSYKPGDLHAGNDLIMGGLHVDYLESAIYGTEPVFTEDGAVEEKIFMAYGGMMRQPMESWGAFFPEAGGPDSCTVTVAAGTELNARVQPYVQKGIATVTEQGDGSRTVTYRGIRRGAHLALGDIQYCAMNVLRYLMKSRG